MEVRSGYKLTEAGVIPEDWCVRTIGELAAIRTGPFGTLLKAGEYSSTNGVPLISVGEIRQGFLRVTAETPRVPDAVVRRLPQYVLRKGDIVLGRKGGVERSALIRQGENGWFLGSDGISIRASGGCHDEYLALQFRSHQIQEWLAQNATGTTMPSLNQEILKRLIVPLPPTQAEQEAIAAALSAADALIESLDQLIAKKRDIKRGTTQELLSGETRLPGFQRASNRIRETDAGLIPEDWDAEKLGDCLTEPPAYGINAPAVPYEDKLPAYVRITDIGGDGRLSSKNSVSVHAPNSADYLLEDGDLVFARTGASVGKSYRHIHSDGRLVFAGFLIRVRPNPLRLNPSFLAAFATTGQYWNWVRLMSMRSGQPGINGNEYAQMPIPRPSIEEQTAIAAILSDMDAEITEHDAKLAKARQIKQGMMQNLLTGKIRLV
jgi:type I restriction enzyme, S subunit